MTEHSLLLTIQLTCACSNFISNYFCSVFCMWSSSTKQSRIENKAFKSIESIKKQDLSWSPCWILISQSNNNYDNMNAQEMKKKRDVVEPHHQKRWKVHLSDNSASQCCQKYHIFTLLLKIFSLMTMTSLRITTNILQLIEATSH